MASLSLLQIPPGVYVTVTGFIGTVMRTMTARGSGKSLQLPSSSLEGFMEGASREGEEQKRKWTPVSSEEL